ncbi:hypothetical protein [Halopelagius fulvigenes]|uniref:Uncharacterized protein n=1 Tax=Halopelagius fulvigenes TaxID=1198324 RepID=A0ABD5TUD2_9EURY
MRASTPPSASAADPVETVVRRLSVPAGTELARSLLRGVGADAMERHGAFSAALGAVRAVSRRLDVDVPEVCAAAAELGIDPRDALAAERKLEAELSPPGDRDDVERLSSRITAYAVLLDALENGVSPDDLSASVDDTAEFDAAAVSDHLGRLKADKAMAQLGFRLYDIARDDDESDAE